MKNDTNGRIRITTLHLIAAGVVGLATLGFIFGQIAYFSRSEGLVIAAEAKRNKEEIQGIKDALRANTEEQKKLGETLREFIGTVNEERARMRGMEEERRRRVNPRGTD